MGTPLRLAIQKSGRLSDATARLVEDCGIELEIRSAKLKCNAVNFPLELLYLRDDDIPGYVEEGVADAGIVGENVVAESGSDVRFVERLGFGHCRLSIAVPAGFEYQSPTSLQGLSIATSYPRLLGKYLADQRVDASIHESSGSVEIAPSIGLADAVCDLVGTGSTLISNGLKEVETLLKSQAVLIATTELSRAKDESLERFRFRIQAVQRARRYKYILLNVPESSLKRVAELLPGMKSPTIMPLAEEGWYSMHSVVLEDEFWEIVDELQDAGAQGVLVSPVEKMVL